jgi:hypothetical protein
MTTTECRMQLFVFVGVHNLLATPHPGRTHGHPSIAYSHALPMNGRPLRQEAQGKVPKHADASAHTYLMTAMHCAWTRRSSCIREKGMHQAEPGR